MKKVFVGRERELERLKILHEKGMPGLVVVKGRRRVGKSRLIDFFASTCEGSKFWDFSALAPQPDMDAQRQLDHFSQQLSVHVGLPPFSFRDWTEAFESISRYVNPGDVVLLDEISWMGSKDPTFIPKLKAWWDRQKVPMMLVFCGSVSTWIEENILKSTAFFGRVNLTITLEPLSIPEANKLLRVLGFQGSDYDTYRLLSILGGVPWYLEQVVSGKTVDALVKQLCFEKDGLLVLEFDRIFHDLFNGRGGSYKKILDCLKDGAKTLADIRKSIGFSHSGTLSTLMDNLIVAGFVQKQQLWSFKTNKALKQSLYRISDPYMRFYLKLIEPQRNKIDLGDFQGDVGLPGIDVHMGFQLEQLLLQNRNKVLKSIGVRIEDIVASGPFRQFKTLSKKGCQIDYLVQMNTKTLFVCEFKFKQRELGLSVISEMQDKIDALKVPRGFAVIPVLFHIGGVSDHVATSQYFYRIIDIVDFLGNEGGSC